MDESLVTEATLVDTKVKFVDAPDAAVAVIPWSGVLGDVEVCNSLVTEETLVDAMLEIVDAPRSVASEV